MDLMNINPNFTILSGLDNGLINELQNIIKVQRNTLIVASTKCRTGTDIALRDGWIDMANTIITALEKFKQKWYVDPKTWQRVDLQTKSD